MTTKPDRRVRRTRQALQDALLALMAHKSYPTITIQDIIDRADVGRSTFYTHYTDRDDLLQDCFDELRAIIKRPPTNEPGNQNQLLRFSLPLFRHVNEKRDLTRALLNSRDTPVFGQIEQLIGDIVRRELSALLSAISHSPIPREAVIHYIVGAYLALLSWWLENDASHTPENIDQIFQTLTNSGLGTVGTLK